MMLCLRSRRLTVPVIVMTLSATPKNAAASQAPTNCPGTPAGATSMQALEACRQAARTSEGRERAQHYSAGLALAREAYVAGRTGGRAWLENDGHSFVHYGTKGCDTAVDLEPTEAIRTLDQCIGLLGMHIVDLTTASASNASTAAELKKRRDRLRELRAALPAETDLAIKPPPPPPPPPARSPPPSPPEAPQKPPRPRGLYAGLGTGAGLALLSSVTLGVSWSMGDRAQSKIHPSDVVDPQDTGKAACDLSPQPSGCVTLEQAKRLFIASAIGLSLGAATMAVFGGLLARHRAQRHRKTPGTVFIVPSRGGLTGGFSLRF